MTTAAAPALVARSAAEIISLVPAVLGYRPRNSLVALVRDAEGGGPVLRVDLPPAEISDEARRRFAAHVVGLICRVPGASTAFLVVLTDDPLASGLRPAHTALVDSVGLRLRDAGVRLRASWCVASDAWGVYGARRLGDPERGPLPLDLLQDAESRVAPDRLPAESIDSLVALPEPDPLWLADVDRELHRLGWDDEYLARVIEPRHAADAWERVIAARGNPPAGLVAQAILTIADLRLRDALMIQCLYGREPDDAMIVAGVDAPYADELESRPMSPDVERLLEKMMGRNETGPGRRDTERAIETMRLVATAAGDLTPAPLAVLSWMSWIGGHSSLAAAYAEAALDIADYSFARLMLDFLDAGMIPDWLGRRPPA